MKVAVAGLIGGLLGLPLVVAMVWLACAHPALLAVAFGLRG